jgi:hypothetical protein
MTPKAKAAQFAGMDPYKVKRLRELVAENAKCKSLLAEMLLDKVALGDVVSGYCSPLSHCSLTRKP